MLPPRRAFAFVLTAFALLSACGQQPRAHHWSIVVHGGAGVIERAQLTPELEAQYRSAMNHALQTGAAILDRGGSSLDAVQAVISDMEDDPLFNAGRGAVFGADGKNHLDASIMDGRSRAAGAVADVTRTRHPIQLARAVMEHSPHVMLVGEGAEAFGRTQNIEQVEPSFFFTERRWQQLVQELRARNLPIPPRPAGAPPAPQGALLFLDDHKFGTVGVVAMDEQGNIAAGTSTGGTNAKLWGRVGDSPIIGAGTYAQNGVCGVSATGTGEYFIRVGVARDICARMELRHETAEQASQEVFAELGAMHGDGGVIVMDGRGHAAWRFNTPGMYRARLEQGGRPLVQIFADED
ncbi:MAG: isoaspartyl peptidase/L-asparaginase [Proteobacteria bacterium]|nr:isoaspartyl peptidase/L-asparaginase [Pseudomonadota bacterium]